jgi:hypothetical protein
MLRSSLRPGINKRRIYTWRHKLLTCDEEEGRGCVPRLLGPPPHHTLEVCAAMCIFFPSLAAPPHAPPPRPRRTGGGRPPRVVHIHSPPPPLCVAPSSPPPSRRPRPPLRANSGGGGTQQKRHAADLWIDSRTRKSSPPKFRILPFQKKAPPAPALSQSGASVATPKPLLHLPGTGRAARSPEAKIVKQISLEHTCLDLSAADDDSHHLQWH